MNDSHGNTIHALLIENTLLAEDEKLSLLE
jgi:hypothetical protein